MNHSGIKRFTTDDGPGYYAKALIEAQGAEGTLTAVDMTVTQWDPDGTGTSTAVTTQQTTGAVLVGFTAEASTSDPKGNSTDPYGQFTGVRYTFRFFIEDNTDWTYTGLA